MFLTRITLMKIQKWKVAYNNYRLSKFEKLVKNQKSNIFKSQSKITENMPMIPTPPMQTKLSPHPKKNIIMDPYMVSLTHI